MDTIEILKKAIKERKSISYQYNASSSISGVRFGDPHAIFISSKDNINMHVWKTGGDNLSTSKSLPSWREYLVKNIFDVKILENKGKFELAEGYNPNSPSYKRIIVRA